MRRFFIKFLCTFILGRARRKRIRFLLLNRPRLKYACDIPNVSFYLKSGLRLPHPVGIVISKKVKIGEGCMIYQNVTLGARENNRTGCSEYPVIGNDVRIYAGATVIGDISIGENSVIGANSVVTRDVPANEVWAGVPSRFIRKIGSA